MVGPYALLLFGGVVEVQHRAGEVTVDGWSRFRVAARTAVLLRELRVGAALFLVENDCVLMAKWTELDALLRAKIEQPDLDIASSPVSEAIALLLLQ
jgi:hypothetical protein